MWQVEGPQWQASPECQEDEGSDFISDSVKVGGRDSTTIRKKTFRKGA